MICIYIYICTYYFLSKDKDFLLPQKGLPLGAFKIPRSRRFKPQPADLTVSRTERFKMDRDKVLDGGGNFG